MRSNNRAKIIIDYICRSLIDTGVEDNIRVSMAYKTRLKLFGSIESPLAKSFYYNSRLQAASYWNDYKGTGRTNFCKKTNISIDKLYNFFLLAIEDERVKFSKGEFIFLEKITESKKEMKQRIESYIYSQYKDEIDSRKFNYKETNCGRKYHPLQNLKKKTRSNVLKMGGLEHDYDIVSAMPTILSQKAGITWSVDTISKITEESGVSRSIVKKVINSQFYKGRLSVYSKVLEGFAYFKKKSIINQLKKSSTYNDAILKIKEINSKKLNYFIIEREITECFERFARTAGIGIFTIHDGFVSDTAISEEELEYYIQQETGIKVKLSYNHL